jgi:uncharacterized membrane protein
MFYMHSVGWGWWLVMSIGMIAFLAVVIMRIVLLRGRLRTGTQPSGDSPRADAQASRRRGEKAAA